VVVSFSPWWFGDKLCMCLCLLTNSGKDLLDQPFIGLEISEIVRDQRQDHSCSL
jgi:hypothetical protein